MKPRRHASWWFFTALSALLAAPNSVHAVVGFAVDPVRRLSGRAFWCAEQLVDADMTRSAPEPKPARSRRAAFQPGEAVGRLAKRLSGMVGCGCSGWPQTCWPQHAAVHDSSFTLFSFPCGLKRRDTAGTSVIVRAACAFPAVDRWIIATGSFSVEAWLIVRAIFMWTRRTSGPGAVYAQWTYDDAEVPMLTVTHGRRSNPSSHFWASILVLLVILASLPLTTIGGRIYLVTAGVLNLLFLDWRVPYLEA